MSWSGTVTSGFWRKGGFRAGYWISAASSLNPRVSSFIGPSAPSAQRVRNRSACPSSAQASISGATSSLISARLRRRLGRRASTLTEGAVRINAAAPNTPSLPSHIRRSASRYSLVPARTTTPRAPQTACPASAPSMSSARRNKRACLIA